MTLLRRSSLLSVFMFECRAETARQIYYSCSFLFLVTPQSLDAMRKTTFQWGESHLKGEVWDTPSIVNLSL